MIRVLVIIAVTGFLVSVISLTAAVAIVGPEAIAHGAWSWDPDRGWNGERDVSVLGRSLSWRGSHGDRSHGDRPQVTRDMAWTGGDSIEVELPADVRYTQAAGPAKLVVTGPKDAVDDVEIDGGRVRFKSDNDHDDAELTIVMTAPSVTRFDMSGSGKLAIANYRQDHLTLDLSGDADVSAAGDAKALDLRISGSANAALGGLATRSAEVNIEGSGDATLAPTETARIDISGSGDVTLLTHPARLDTNISGSGNIHQKDGGSTSPASEGSKTRT